MGNLPQFRRRWTMRFAAQNHVEQSLHLRLRLLHQPQKQRHFRTSFTPDEIATLTIEFYRRNYIEGLFFSSGVLRNPDQALIVLENPSLNVKCMNTITIAICVT